MRFVGDIVAAVVAETRAQAVDAAERVVVDYDPLPSVIEPASTRSSPDAPLLFAEHGSNVCFGTTFPEEGDADPLAGADVVAEVTMVSQRLAGVPMETNGILAVPGEPRSHLLGLPPGAARDARARTPPMLGLEPAQLRVVCPWVGGGFGPKAGAVRRAPRRPPPPR